MVSNKEHCKFMQNTQINQDANEWRRRHAKRALDVWRFKTTPAYKRSDASCRGLTPDPSDRSLSKRAWNFQMLSWHHTLQRRSDVNASFTGNADAYISNLSGDWVDNSGVLQTISKSQNNAIHLVATSFPSQSRTCCTGASFVIAMLTGYAEPTWATHFTYKLEHWSQNELVWIHMQSKEVLRWRRKEASHLNTVVEAHSRGFRSVAPR